MIRISKMTREFSDGYGIFISPPPAEAASIQ